MIEPPKYLGRFSDSLALALGSIVSGLFAYVFFAITTRALGPVVAAPISVLWTFWGFLAAALTLPVQHWIIHVTESGGGESSVRAELPRLWSATSVLACFLTVVTWALGEQLFETRGIVFPVLIGAVTLGACWSGVIRGVLSAKRRFVATSLAIVGENGVRLALGLVVGLTGQGAAMFGVALIAGPLIGLVWTRDMRLTTPPTQGDHRGGIRLIGGIGLGGLIGQIVLTSGPAVIALLNGPARLVTALFASLALFRLPQVILIGLLSQITGKVSTMVWGRRHEQLRRVRQLILVATATATAIGATVGATVGGYLVELLFGEGLGLPRTTLALLGAGSALALGNLVEGVILTAHQASRQYVSGWLAGLLVAGLVLALPVDPLQKTVLAFSSAELTAFSLLFIGEWKTARTTISADPL